ncbi:AAA family ATPase [Paucibacter sp. XJ19-41]|uniref:AAA family ATPase n=1 Tax=Paucibacter sp. XJ19-41 TaxID=2927824 RepID=UPI00234AA64F|nr:AAA family ATPase [Paucibacter sp. XJ19-41]MDC6168108.1 AAA family ATPase [Paucibacter sp. XJ19-41]
MTIARKPYLLRAGFHPDAQPDFDTYPFSIAAVRDLAQIDFHPDVTFFVGENGAGKSTVLEALAVALGHNPEGGTRNASFQTTGAAVSPLHEALRLVRSAFRPSEGYFLRAESLFNVATYLDEIGGPAPSLHACSHGEAFMAVLFEQLRGQGLYLLDEPEAALSPNRQLAALRVIDELVRKGSQFIIATHSPILLAYPRARILQFDAAGITELRYEDTEHYAVTRDFLNHYPRRLEQLLKDEN